MEKRALSEKKLTLPQVKSILESLGEPNLDQFQRRTLDYASKFSKVNAEVAEELLGKLVKEFGIDEDEAIQIVNCMPETLDELRVFLAGGRKIIESSKLEAIVKLLNACKASK
jgi:DNA-directed RNA polymerase subunit F